MAPPSKPPGQRIRRNRPPATAATLAFRPMVARVELAELDAGQHRPETLRFWDAIWSSPARPEWDASDVRGGLLVVAALFDRFYSPDRRGLGVRLSREIAAHLRALGLTPQSRAALFRAAPGLAVLAHPPSLEAPDHDAQP